MLAKPQSNTLAGISYSFAAAIPIGSWAILLLVANPSGLTLGQAVRAQLKYTFSAENPNL